ncbi:filensin [Petromyzon marinus]|uniref:Filensin n=1 Tax=Petromyzon marinus TaxID=7757 RepID=A0AAJ7SSI2_PETMA|nr:filensin [Petromyzon marinus]
MSQPSGVGVPRGDDRHRGAASPPRRGLAERQEVTASIGARDPARRDDGLGRWGAGSLARFEPSALHSRLSPPPQSQSAHFDADAAEVDEVRELSAHLGGFIGRARALEQRSLVLRQQLEKARRLAQLSGPEDVYSECLGLTEQRLDDLKAEERRLRRELEAARGEETDYKSRWKSESDNLQRLREDLGRLSHDAHEALSAHLALQIETQALMEDVAFTRDAHKQHLSELRESVELVGQMMSSIEGLSPDVWGTTEAGQLQHEMGTDCQGGAGGTGEVHQQQQVAELRVQVDSLSSRQRALQDECQQLERNLREAEGASEAELSRATAKLQAHRVELAQALGALRSNRAENERLWASTRDLETELTRYRRAIENEDSRLHSVIIGAVPATVHTLERRCVPELVSRELGRGAQSDSDSVIVRARGRKLAESTSPMEDPCSGHTAPGEDVFETEGRGKDRSGKTGMEAWTGRKRNEEEGEDDEAGGDVPDGLRFSRAYSKVKDFIREKIGSRDAEDCVSETSSSEEDIAVYTMPSSVCVTGHGSWPQPSCYYEPSLGHVTVVEAEVEDEHLHPLPSLGPLPAPPPPPSDPSLDGDTLVPLDPMLMPDHVPPHPPAPPSVPDTEQSRESKEPATPAREASEEKKYKDEKGKDKGPEPSHDADRKKCDADNEAKDGDKTSIGKTPPSSPQETLHDEEKTKSATDLGSRALGRPGVAGEFTSSSISYEKLEVMESTETTVDDKRQDYEEKSLVIETSVERKETFSSH